MNIILFMIKINDDIQKVAASTFYIDDDGRLVLTSNKRKIAIFRIWDYVVPLRKISME